MHLLASNPNRKTTFMHVPALNDDCWLLVLDNLFGDFRSLARLMQVSRQILALAGSTLYGQLGHPANLKRIQHVSILSRDQLIRLLLISGGLWEENLGASDSYPISLGFDYFGCIKQLPIGDMSVDFCSALKEGIRKLKKLEKQKKRDDNYIESVLGLARVMTEISLEVGIQNLLWMGKHLGQLSKLTHIKGVPRRELIKFVNRHVTLFPGQLKEVEDPEEALGLNGFFRPKRICFRRFDQMNNIFVGQKFFTKLNEIEFADESIDNNLFSEDPEISAAEELEIGDGLQNTKALLNTGNCKGPVDFFKKCRQLEKVKMTCTGSAARHVQRHLSSLFAWAREELKTAVEKDPIREQKLQSGTDLSVPISTTWVDQSGLVRLKKFSGRQLPRRMFFDIVDGFRYTLEEVDFEFLPNNTVRQSMALNNQWTWILPRLTVLTLTNARIQMSKIELCPALEELSLKNVRPPLGVEDDRWKLPKSLRVLRIVEGLVMRGLNLASLSELGQLEELMLSYWIKGVDKRMDRVAMLNWSFPKLKILNLGEKALYHWHRLLMRAAPNIHTFTSPFNAILYPSWWYETAEESFRAEAFHEDNKDMDDTTRERLEQMAKEQSRELNVYHTKIRSLGCFDGNWTILKSLKFAELLRGASPTETVNESESMGIKNTIHGEGSGVAFPLLRFFRFVNFSSCSEEEDDEDWEVDDGEEYGDNEPDHEGDEGLDPEEVFEDVLLALMQKPSMRYLIQLDVDFTDKFERQLIRTQHFHERNYEKVKDFAGTQDYDIGCGDVDDYDDVEGKEKKDVGDSNCKYGDGCEVEKDEEDQGDQDLDEEDLDEEDLDYSDQDEEEDDDEDEDDEEEEEEDDDDDNDDAVAFNAQNFVSSIKDMERRKFLGERKGCVFYTDNLLYRLK